MLSADHKRVKSEGRDRACVLTTNVNEDGALSVIFTIHIVAPVSLPVSGGLLVVKVVDFVVEPMFGKVTLVDSGQIARC